MVINNGIKDAKGVTKCLVKTFRIDLLGKQFFSSCRVLHTVLDVVPDPFCHVLHDRSDRRAGRHVTGTAKTPESIEVLPNACEDFSMDVSFNPVPFFSFLPAFSFESFPTPVTDAEPMA